MCDEPVFDKVAELKVIPVVAVEDERQALALADALTQGGLPVAEITFRTAAAEAVIRRMAKQRPDMLVGAGTVLTPETVRKAKDCGASFAVSPGLNPEVVKEAQRVGLPMAPGVMTPSDVECALGLGCRVLKFFPAEAAGGSAMLKSLSAPYAHLGVRFIPTGGINAANLSEYLSLTCVLGVGGTWIAKKADIAAGDWEGIAESARQAGRIAAQTV